MPKLVLGTFTCSMRTERLRPQDRVRPARSALSAETQPMSSSGLVSIFEPQPRPAKALSSMAVSLLLHGVGLTIFGLGLLRAPRIKATPQYYTMRHLDLTAPAYKRQETTDSTLPYPSPELLAQLSLDAEDVNARAEALQQMLHAIEGPQTLIQPKLKVQPPQAVPVPVATTLIWTPELNSPQEITAPAPAPPTAATSKPSFDAPNEELTLAPQAVTAAHTPAQASPLVAGSSSPVVVHAKSDVQMAPAMAVTSTHTPSPAAVLSISDQQMVQGRVILPPVNQTHSVTRAGDRALDSTAPGSTMQVLGSNAGTGGQASAEHIQLPRNGKFGVVVVGSMLSEQYPETQQIWGSRAAYTAYIHVGLSRNWILQYGSTPPQDEVSDKLEAPWPYDIERPNDVAKDLNADALIVHGVVSDVGSFASLQIVFPPEYPHGDAVLSALQQWQFRPAKQGGKAVAVEVLLIIPNEPD